MYFTLLINFGIGHSVRTSILCDGTADIREPIFASAYTLLIDARLLGQAWENKDDPM